MTSSVSRSTLVSNLTLGLSRKVYRATGGDGRFSPQDELNTRPGVVRDAISQQRGVLDEGGWVSERAVVDKVIGRVVGGVASVVPEGPHFSLNDLRRLQQKDPDAAWEVQQEFKVLLASGMDGAKILKHIEPFFSAAMMGPTPSARKYAAGDVSIETKVMHHPGERHGDVFVDAQETTKHNWWDPEVRAMPLVEIIANSPDLEFVEQRSGDFFMSDLVSYLSLDAGRQLGRILDEANFRADVSHFGLFDDTSDVIGREVFVVTPQDSEHSLIVSVEFLYSS